MSYAASISQETFVVYKLNLSVAAQKERPQILFAVSYIKQKLSDNLSYREFFVPQTGLEPVRPCGHRILSPACLPIPPPGQSRS